MTNSPSGCPGCLLCSPEPFEPEPDFETNVVLPDPVLKAGFAIVRGEAPKTWDDALDMVLFEMRTIMIERQKKYGPNNIRQQGLFGVVTRAADDKISRVRGALQGRVVNGQVVLDPIDDGSEAADTFEDGLLDAANYLGPIALMVKRGWWDLPRA